MKRTQADDLKYGMSMERRTKSRIEQLVGEEIILGGGYNTFDYHNKTKTVYVELKSRRICHDDYPTAIIGKNKVDFCTDPSKEYYFVYNYNDGIYYIKYDKELFDTFEVKRDYIRGDRIGCPGRANDVVYIPVSHLTPAPPNAVNIVMNI
jgi:hypothetical protein